jgi:hypothetical protein
MIDNIQNHQVAHAMGMNALPRTDVANKRVADESDATLQVDFGDLVSRAMQTTDEQADAVQKARELLQSGRLTSLENIRSAAENIASSGI